MYSLEQIACRGQDKTITNMKLFLAIFQNVKVPMTHERPKAKNREAHKLNLFH